MYHIEANIFYRIGYWHNKREKYFCLVCFDIYFQRTDAHERYNSISSMIQTYQLLLEISLFPTSLNQSKSCEWSICSEKRSVGEYDYIISMYIWEAITNSNEPNYCLHFDYREYIFSFTASIFEKKRRCRTEKKSNLVCCHCQLYSHSSITVYAIRL